MFATHLGNYIQLKLGHIFRNTLKIVVLLHLAPWYSECIRMFPSNILPLPLLFKPEYGGSISLPPLGLNGATKQKATV
jgi:hypothetical protein